ncbi:hypothetical protein EW026_g4216 [Hermanssonia centrifuga]|uniref:Uncharacterized protein n=1 Tax=Hermanssonia centrifuga TaxID=98765 RepID=A0A4S4KHV4_9APHY|nr:hypothetical protein EW026_g4216 [Hermanssonia centrifuga]
MDVDGIRALLVSRFASVNDVDPNGDGILHYVAFHTPHHPYERIAEFMKLLLDAGAHPEWENKDRVTAMDALTFNEMNRYNRSRSPNFGTTSELQLYIAGDVNASEKWGGWTALEWGIACHSPNVVNVLVECGADLNRGFPLHFAARYGNIEALKALVDAGADFKSGYTTQPHSLKSARYDCKWIQSTQSSLRYHMLDHSDMTPFQIAERKHSQFPAGTRRANDYATIIDLLSGLQQADPDALCDESETGDTDREPDSPYSDSETDSDTDPDISFYDAPECEQL